MSVHNKNGKYMGFFDTLEQVENYKKNVLDFFRYIDKEKLIPIKEFSERERMKGIKLYVEQLRRWLLDNDVRVRKPPTTTNTSAIPLRVYPYLIDLIKMYPVKRSKLFDWGLRLVLGLPIHDAVFLYLNDDYQSIIFYLLKYKEIRIIATEDVTDELVKSMQSIADMAIKQTDKHPLEYLRDFAKHTGLRAFGGNINNFHKEKTD